MKGVLLAFFLIQLRLVRTDFRAKRFFSKACLPGKGSKLRLSNIVIIPWPGNTSMMIPQISKHRPSMIFAV